MLSRCRRQKVARQIDVGLAKRPMTLCMLEAIIRSLTAGKPDVPVAETLEIGPGCITSVPERLCFRGGLRVIPLENERLARLLVGQASRLSVIYADQLNGRAARSTN